MCAAPTKQQPQPPPLSPLSLRGKVTPAAFFLVQHIPRHLLFAFQRHTATPSSQLQNPPFPPPLTSLQHHWKGSALSCVLVQSQGGAANQRTSSWSGFG